MAAPGNTGVDEDAGVMKGVILVQKGPAKYFYQDPASKVRFQMYVGDAFLDALAKVKSIIVRADPPPDDVHGGALSVQGEATNLRRDGDAVRGDISFIDPVDPVPRKLMKIGLKAPHLAAMSLVFTFRALRSLSAKMQEVLPIDVMFVDFVSKGAAASALFSQSQVDTTDEGVNYTFLRKQCAKFGIQFPATDPEVTPEIATKAEADVEAKLAAMQTENGTVAELKTKLSEAEKKGTAQAPAPIDAAKLTADITLAVVAKLKAEGLSHVGTRPAAGDPNGGPDPDPNAGKKVALTPKITALAASLKQKPEELQANLAKLDATQQDVCLKLSLDPVAFLADKAKYGKVAETMPI